MGWGVEKTHRIQQIHSLQCLSEIITLALVNSMRFQEGNWLSHSSAKGSTFQTKISQQFDLKYYFSFCQNLRRLDAYPRLVFVGPARITVKTNDLNVTTPYLSVSP